ncbi:MAG TPA: DMT family transporter [Bacillales bacterium]|nr:DMT family transporter [Bacillales bacterium]
MLVFVVLCYSGNILVGKAINELPPFTIAFFRLVIAFIVLFPFGWRGAWEYRLKFLENKRPFAVMTLTGVTFFNTFIYGSLQFTTSSNVAILETVIPVVTVVLSAFLLRERLKGIQWAGILLSFVGAVWVVMDGHILRLAAIDWNVGDVIMIGAIFAWAVYSVAVKQYMHLFPSYGALLVMTGLSVMILFPIVLVEWSVTGVPAPVMPDHLAGLLYLGIFPSFIALLCYNRVVDLLGASQASVFLNFLPVVTMAGAYFWLGEAVTMMQVGGALAVMTGVILTTHAGEKRRIVHANEHVRS